MQRIVGITISNSQCLLLGFSFRSTPQHMWIMGVYIVWVQIVCIRNDNLVKQNVSRVSREKALPVKHLRKPAVSILSWLFAFQSCVGHMLHFAGSLLASYLQKQLQSSFALSLHTHSFSHTTLTNKSHMKYMVHKIEQNYNQIWHRIKANKNVVVNYNFTISPFNYSVTKPLKQTLDLNVNLGIVAKLTHT